MNVICIHHRLAGYSSHHFHEAQELVREMRRRGRKLELLVNTIAEPRIVAQLGARAVFDDPTFRLEWSFAERSRRFVAMLHKHADRLVRRDDLVMLTIATQLEAHALTRWLQELPARRKPWIVVLFLSDRWNRAGRDEYERQALEFRETAAAIASLTRDDASRMIFAAVTQGLANELSVLVGTKVEVAPMPQAYTHLDGLAAAPRSSTIPRVAILGGTRREKGSHHIPDIIRATRGVEFVVHLMNNTLTPEEVQDLARIEREPRVSVIRDALPSREYANALLGADLLLFPYEQIPYRQRCSGVFAEAVSFGKPVVVTPGTWMAEQIEAGRAAGVIADGIDAEAFAHAIAQCVANLDALRQSAGALRDAFRKEISLPAFVDFMEAKIGIAG